MSKTFHVIRVIKHFVYTEVLTWKRFPYYWPFVRLLPWIPLPNGQECVIILRRSPGVTVLVGIEDLLHVALYQESESESEIVYSIDIHRIHLQIKLYNTITHTHINRWWYMESPQCHRRSKVANPIAPPSPAAPPAVIKQLRAPPATTKAARSATVPLSGHGQVVSFTSLKLCNRYHILLHAMYSR